MTRKRFKWREIERLAQEAGGWKQMAEQMEEAGRRMDRDLQCLSTRYREFQEKYPNRYVVLHNGELVGTAKDLAQLGRLWTKLEREKGIPRGETTFKYIHPPGKEPRYVFMRRLRRAVQAA